MNEDTGAEFEKEYTGQTLQFPLLLGPLDGRTHEKLTETEFGQMPLGERELIQRLSQFSFGGQFWEHYRGLRGLGHKHQDAAVGAWLATGVVGRGNVITKLALAEVMGVSRHTLYRIVERVQGAAQALRLSWLQERIPDVDEALYRAAVLVGEHASQKLFYQRARVPLSGEDSEARDDWADLMRKLRDGAE